MRQQSSEFLGTLYTRRKTGEFKISREMADVVNGDMSAHGCEPRFQSEPLSPVVRFFADSFSYTPSNGDGSDGVATGSSDPEPTCAQLTV